ncbi:MAG: diguanylate cyclase/phosphodiesterase with PAS/PAC sensor(s) [Osedax symbiont Rs2]|nr:MAG: diguanylate cyclase/phosphodiesterase with PAS/PAC sensor(s) [Osedax symbiont Rs2]
MAKIGGWEIDLHKDSLFWTEETYLLHDTTPENYTPTVASAINFYAPEWIPIIRLALKTAIEKGISFDHELELITATGRRIWVHVYGTVVLKDGHASKVLGAFQDISDKKKAELEIWQKSNFDFLTELPNRRMFRYCLEKKIKAARRSNTKVALLFIDLDHFKEINDTYGHDWGDSVIKDAAGRLNDCIRDSDTLARLGGDEFTIIIDDLNDYCPVQRIVNDILKKMSEPFQIEAEVAYMSASIGITLYPDNATEIDALLKYADQAMYVAKDQGRNRFQYYTTSMQEAALARRVIVNNLRVALANNEFQVVYQPIVELNSNSIHKAEALIRWHHPTRGLISPADFISVAEETGLIIDIGEWIFQQAAQQVKLWRRSFNPDFQISVNTSPVQYHNTDNKLNLWINYLSGLNLPGSAIVAEITEGVLMDIHSEILDKLRAFREENIQISLDDFGTGYSSLSYLRKFEIDYLKIDQSFVRNMKSNSKDIALCEAIIAMAHKLGITVIAEGIETLEHKDLLIKAGCDFGQGYLFSKPLSAIDFQAMLVTQQNNESRQLV